MELCEGFQSYFAFALLAGLYGFPVILILPPSHDHSLELALMYLPDTLAPYVL